MFLKMATQLNNQIMNWLAIIMASAEKNIFSSVLSGLIENLS